MNVGFTYPFELIRRASCMSNAVPSLCLCLLISRPDDYATMEQNPYNQMLMPRRGD